MATVRIKEEELKALREKATFYDCFLACDEAFSSSEIGELFGISAKKLHTILHEAGILTKSKDPHASLSVSAPYLEKCPRVARTFVYLDRNGRRRSSTALYWTQKARTFLIHWLCEHGYYDAFQERAGVKILGHEDAAHED